MLESLQTLTKDLRKAARTLSDADVRYLVDAYYQMQRDRIRADHQIRQASVAEEPHETLRWLSDNTALLEKGIRSVLGIYTDESIVGRWSKSITGIGPVIAAGLLAHVDIARAPTVGHLWAFAGLDPTRKWGKGTKRPWNAKLKRLCWLIGESFVKVSGRETDVYGKVYVARKALEQERNTAGVFADQARASLTAKRWGAETTARASYEKGQLPPARIHLRAERYATKLFLAHWHHVAYETHYGQPPPKPYVFDHVPGHAHFVKPPNWPMVDA